MIVYLLTICLFIKDCFIRILGLIKRRWKICYWNADGIIKAKLNPEYDKSYIRPYYRWDWEMEYMRRYK